MFSVKRARGVFRPALALVIPVLRAGAALDAGANVEVRPEHLVQFAHMGAAFMEGVMGVERPRSRCCPTARSEEGPRSRRRPRDCASNSAGLKFVGNVEGTMRTGAADVIEATASRATWP